MQGKTQLMPGAELGLGPMVIHDDSLVLNQSEVIKSITERVRTACRWLETTDEILGRTAPHNVISLVGGRGTGKTSLLITLCEKIAAATPNAICVDPLVPERFHPSYPVAPAIIHAVETTIERSATDIARRDLQERARDIYELRWALDIDKTFDVIARDSLNAVEWSEKLTKLLVNPVDTVAMFREWLGRALKEVKKELVVVPIDDVDIQIEKGEEIIDTIRTYLSDPHILTIVALDLGELERRIRNKRLTSLPHLPQGGEKNPMFLFGMTSGEFHKSEAQREADYVESLLAKVLPPASRYHLTSLSEHEKLHTKLQLPGVGKRETLLELLAIADGKSTAAGCPPLVPLFKAHPEILSDNIRRYINQYVLIGRAVSDFLSHEEPSDESSESETHNKAQHSIGSSPKAQSADFRDDSFLDLSAPKNRKEAITAGYQASVVKALLTDPAFMPIQGFAISELGLDLAALPTIHHYIRFFLERCSIRGSHEFRFRYGIGSLQLDSSVTSGLVDFCFDWAIKSGLSVYEVTKSIEREAMGTLSFRPVPISKWIANKLSETSLAQIEPVLEIIHGSTGNRVGTQVIVPGDNDRLVPAFCADSTSLGRYFHSVIKFSRFERFDEDARSYAEELDKRKESEVKTQDIISGLYRMLGMSAIQTLYHVDGMLFELSYGGDTSRLGVSRFDIQGSASCSWVVNRASGFWHGLNAMLNRQELGLPEKLIGLTFLADLPMRLILAVTCGEDAEAGREKFCKLSSNVLDQLSDLEVLVRRQRGTLEMGCLSKRLREKGKFFVESLNYNYKTLDWNRRFLALGKMLRTIRTWEFQKKWDGYSEPPASWVKWAMEISKSHRSRRGKAKNVSKSSRN